MTNSSYGKRVFIIVSLLAFFIATPSYAEDISLTTLYSAATAAAAVVQEEFDLLSRDLGRGIHLNPGNSPEPLGIIGFNVGAEVSLIKVDEGPIKLASGQGVNGSYLIAPKFRAQKGLPWGIDIGIVYLPQLTEINMGMYGAEFRFDLLEHFPLPTPLLHIAARVSYTKLNGIADLDLQTIGYDLSAGVNIPIVKPYAGVGTFDIKSTPKGDAARLFSEYTRNEMNYFAGVKLTLIPFVPINIEYVKDTFETYSIKIGVAF